MTKEDRIEYLLFTKPVLNKRWALDDPPLIEMEKIYFSHYIDLAHWWYGLTDTERKLIHEHAPERLTTAKGYEKSIYSAIRKQHVLHTKHLWECERRYKNLESYNEQ